MSEKRQKRIRGEKLPHTEAKAKTVKPKVPKVAKVVKKTVEPQTETAITEGVENE